MAKLIQGQGKGEGPSLETLLQEEQARRATAWNALAFIHRLLSGNRPIAEVRYRVLRTIEMILPDLVNPCPAPTTPPPSGTPSNDDSSSS